MSSPGFLVDRSEVDGHTVVRFIGELDMASADHAKTQAMRELTTGVDGTLVLDLSELSFCDSSGLRVLLQLRREAERCGRAIVLQRPHRSVRLVLRVTGTEALFVIDDEQHQPNQ